MNVLPIALALAAALSAPVAAQESSLTEADFAEIVEQAATLEPLEVLLVSHRGETVLAESFNGHSVTAPHNIKSASKSIISALVGIAIDRGVLEGVDQPIAPFFEDRLPEDPDPRLYEITIGNLLSMQAGLTSTSNRNYGAWVVSRDWVRFALNQPFAGDPGGAMQYSTGSTHLLSAILTEATGRSTLDLAEDWLSPITGFDIAGWDRDPQGIYFGGNNMALRPDLLLAFGEVYRNGGRSASGEQVIPPDWIAQSWTPRTRSRMSGESYGYGWFIDEIAGEAVYYGWGYGGQLVYVVPEAELTVVMTSNENQPSAGNGYMNRLTALLGDIIGVVGGEGTP